MDAETFLGAILIATWAAVVLRGLERTAVAARKGRKWERAYLVGWVVGCAFGVGVVLSMKKGTVTALSGPQDDSGLIQISASIQPGSSGGPVIDKYGNIVGIVIGKIDVLQNVNFAIRSSVAANFLSSNRLNPKEGETLREMGSEEIAEQASSFTVRVLCYKSTPLASH